MMGDEYHESASLKAMASNDFHVLPFNLSRYDPSTVSVFFICEVLHFIMYYGMSTLIIRVQ